MMKKFSHLGYKYDENIQPLCTLLPKMSGYITGFDDKTKFIFLIKNDEMLRKYNKIQEKVSNSVKKGFYSESVYNGKYLKTKKKSFISNFHDNGIPKEGSHCICVSVI